MLPTHLTSLENSKIMRDLGFPQESLFHWVLDGVGNDGWSLLYETDVFTLEKEKFERVSAYLATELGEWLSQIESISLNIEYHDGLWYVDFYDLDARNISHQKSRTLPNAMSLMLQYLVLEGLLETKTLV